ncbi:MAG: RcnB family protein [Alphaproteobacteria bacterium]|nr:RcnB family protein [Alphaproteobacteria bacterium]
MKRFITAAAALAMLAAPMGSAFAQGYSRHDDRNDHRPGPAMQAPDRHNDYRDDHRDNRRDDHRDNYRPGPDNHAMNGNAYAYGHAKWHRWGHIDRSDWNRGSRVDWQRHHLDRPRNGYEWREVDGNFVLALAATGMIATVIAASH